MDANLEKDELLRLSIFEHGVALVSNFEVEDDEYEELLDEDGTRFGEKELVTHGFGIGSYLATNKELDSKEALTTLLISIKKAMDVTKKAEENGDVRVEETHKNEIKEASFDETEYK